MSLLTIFVVAICLSFDSFAVSVCSGLSLQHMRFVQAMKIAFSLALFQAVMPLLGWLAGNGIKELIAPIDHWIAFGLLGLIGGKMIVESFKAHESRKINNPLSFKVIITLSFATSIDALAVGFSFSTFLKEIISATFIIGSVTFVASMAGIWVGKKTGTKINKYAELAGGLILIAIGTNILLGHLLEG